MRKLLVEFMCGSAFALLVVAYVLLVSIHCGGI